MERPGDWAKDQCEVRDAEKLKTKAERFGIDATCPSLDELCQTDVDAVALA